MHAYLPCLLLAARRCQKLSLLPLFAKSAAGLVKPSWKYIQMIAIMARRLLANKAYHFAVIRPMLLRCVEVKVIRPMVLCCVKMKPALSMRPQGATIGSQPAGGTFQESDQTVRQESHPFEQAEDTTLQRRGPERSSRRLL